MPNVKLKNRQGNEVIYSNVAKVTLKDENGNDVEFAQGGGDAQNVLDNILSGVGNPFEVTGSYSSIRNCFSGLSNLTKVDLPNLSLINTYAFNGCSNLSYANLPLATSMSSYAFSSCIKLQYVNLPQLNICATGAFQNCAELSIINLPLCSHVGINAFYNCASLVSANFPSCTYIGSGAFANCSLLETISVSTITGSIASSAFKNCANLKSFDMTNISIFNTSAFYGCGFETISLSTLYSYYSGALANCSNAKSFYLWRIQGSFSSSYLSWFQTDFSTLTGLEHINIEASFSFYLNLSYATNLKTISMALYPKDLESDAMQTLTQLEMVNLPNCSQWARGSAFRDKSIFKSIYLNTASKIAADWLFYNCTGLQTFYAPNATEVYGDNMFNGCGLKSLTLEKASRAAQYQFYNMPELETLSLPMLTELAQSCISGCSKLKTIYMPRLFHAMRWAIQHCSSLESIYITSVSAVPYLSSSAINCPSTCKIYVPASLYNNFLTASYWSSMASQFVSV